jgi:2-hydroxychromene-2-carboxylate isomerase
MIKEAAIAYCSQAFARAVGVGWADDLVGVALTDGLDEEALAAGLEEEGLAAGLEEEGLAAGLDEEGCPPVLAPRARILAAACSDTVTM